MSRNMATKLDVRVIKNGGGWLAMRLWTSATWENNCLVWKNTLTDGGYGRLDMPRSLGMEKKYFLAHRLAYNLTRGNLPEDLTLDHLCRNRACINPAHLEPVTHKENTLRGKGFSAQFAKRDACVNGHPFTEENIYKWRGARICKACRRINSLNYRRKKEGQNVSK